MFFIVYHYMPLRHKLLPVIYQTVSFKPKLAGLFHFQSRVDFIPNRQMKKLELTRKKDFFKES